MEWGKKRKNKILQPGCLSQILNCMNGINLADSIAEGMGSIGDMAGCGRVKGFRALGEPLGPRP